MKRLAKMLINKRLEKNLNQTEAANLIGIDRTTLWKIETKNKTNLSYVTIRKIAAFLEISEKDVRELLW